MNSKQKAGLWLGIATAVVMVCYPPWAEGGTGGMASSYAPIFQPPPTPAGHLPEQIDFARLLLQWAMVAMVAGGMIVSGKDSAAPGATPIQLQPRGGFVPNPQQAGSVVLSQPAVEFDSVRQQIHEAKGTAASAVSKQGIRTLRFPDKQAIGDILVESPDDPEYWDLLTSAHGLVEVPSGGRLQLEVRKDEQVELGSLGRPEMSAIVSVDASDSKLGDEDLALVVALKNLQELDLTNTVVSNDGMRHLSRATKLERLWLDGTRVNEDGLSVLRDLPNLKKVSLTNTQVSDSSIIDLREQKKDCQFVLGSSENA